MSFSLFSLCLFCLYCDFFASEQWFCFRVICVKSFELLVFIDSESDGYMLWFLLYCLKECVFDLGLNWFRGFGCWESGGIRRKKERKRKIIWNLSPEFVLSDFFFIADFDLFVSREEICLEFLSLSLSLLNLFWEWIFSWFWTVCFSRRKLFRFSLFLSLFIVLREIF